MARKEPRPEAPVVHPADLPPIGLPRPRLRGAVPLEACLATRRSTRQFAAAPLSMGDVSQLLWAAQGVTGLGGLRTAPSAGALYPVRIFMAAARVRGLPAGLYRYDPDEHYIRLTLGGDLRARLVSDGLDGAAQNAAMLLMLAADLRGPVREFKHWAERLVHIEAGHIAQNVCLEAAALDLGVIGLGAFDSAAARRHMALPDTLEPFYALALGKKIGPPLV